MLSSPLEEGLVVDVNLVRKKISAKLKSEKRAFMQRLNVSRNIRSRVEMNAAVRIQAIYRGHAARCKLDDQISLCTVRKSVRSKLLSFLNESEVAPNIVKDWLSFRQAYNQRRNLNALKIQCAFRRFVSKRVLSCKRMDMTLYRAHMSSIRIQAMSRKAIARIWARKVAEEAKYNLRRNAARRIQNMIRIFVSKRRVQRRRWRLRWVAARMIQCWFRSHRAKRLCFIIRKRTLQWKQFFATRKFQCMIRKFLSRKRLKRMKVRAMYTKRFWAACRIQQRIRGVLGRVCARKRGETVKELSRLAASKLLQETTANTLLLKQKEDLELLLSADIFHQAKQGHCTEVDDILHGRVTDEPQLANQENSEGDTILTIAARLGDVEFCRKCLLWGCNINHKNSVGETALMVAVKLGHVAVVQYLVLHCEESMLSSVSRDDAGILLLAAATGNNDNSREILKTLLSKDLSPSCQSPQLGLTALHGACEVGDLDAVVMLLKARAPADAVDDLGQTPLHKASARSLEVFNYLLQAGGTGIMSSSDISVTVPESDDLVLEIPSPAQNNNSTLSSAGAAATPTGPDSLPNPVVRQGSFGDSSVVVGTPTAGQPLGDSSTVTADAALVSATGENSAKLDWRVGKILRADQDGKDCLLIAIINGETQILETCQSILNASDIVYSAPEEIGWTPNDIVKALNLAQSGNVVCLEHLLIAGFDPAWVAEETGVSLAMTACMHGQRDILDLLMSKGIDLTITDNLKRRTAVHYAAVCKTAQMVSYLLTHQYAKPCKITESVVLMEDIDGRTPLHLSAAAGICLSLSEGSEATDKGVALLERLMAVKDKAGLTPLLAACSNLQADVVVKLVGGSTRKTSVDDRGRNALWHIFHPDASVYSSRPRPVVCSEYVSRSRPSDVVVYPGGTLSRREDAFRLAEDIELVTSLLRRGNRLFSDDMTEAKQVETYLLDESRARSVQNKATGNSIDVDEFGSVIDTAEHGEVLIREKSIMMLKSLPELCGIADCWRLCK
jgi:ankyrin repeat protein